MNTLEPYLLGIIFASIHIISPVIFQYRKHLEPHLSSIAGGFASAYIFLELLPAVSSEHELLGDRIYLIILIGFGIFFGIEYVLHHSKKLETWIHLHASSGIFIAFVYNLLLAMAMMKEVPRIPLAAALFSVLIGFHLLSTNLGLMEEFHQSFVQYGRFLLVGAIILGLGIHLVGEPNEIIADLVTATVAGAILYKVFRHELPDFEETHFLSFGSGAAFFAVTHYLIELYSSGG